MIKLVDILKEVDSILVPRRSKEDRSKNYDSAIQRKIQQYIKDGSKGSLDLQHSKIISLPNNLKHVGGNFGLNGTSITSLPEGLVIEDNLYLVNTSLTTLPKDLEVKGYIVLGRRSILAKKYTDEQIKQMCPKIKGAIFRI